MVKPVKVPNIIERGPGAIPFRCLAEGEKVGGKPIVVCALEPIQQKLAVGRQAPLQEKIRLFFKTSGSLLVSHREGLFRGKKTPAEVSIAFLSKRRGPAGLLSEINSIRSDRTRFFLRPMASDGEGLREDNLGDELLVRETSESLLARGV